MDCIESILLQWWSNAIPNTFSSILFYLLKRSLNLYKFVCCLEMRFPLPGVCFALPFHRFILINRFLFISIRSYDNKHTVYYIQSTLTPNGTTFWYRCEWYTPPYSYSLGFWAFYCSQKLSVLRKIAKILKCNFNTGRPFYTITQSWPKALILDVSPKL